MISHGARRTMPNITNNGSQTLCQGNQSTFLPCNEEMSKDLKAVSATQVSPQYAMQSYAVAQ